MNDSFEKLTTASNKYIVSNTNHNIKIDYDHEIAVFTFDFDRTIVVDNNNIIIPFLKHIYHAYKNQNKKISPMIILSDKEINISFSNIDLTITGIDLYGIFGKINRDKTFVNTKKLVKEI